MGTFLNWRHAETIAKAGYPRPSPTDKGTVLQELGHPEVASMPCHGEAAKTRCRRTVKEPRLLK